VDIKHRRVVTVTLSPDDVKRAIQQYLVLYHDGCNVDQHTANPYKLPKDPYKITVPAMTSVVVSWDEESE
jgi:archaellum component FlaF (FlaF/FlaG flagellin family)